MEKGEIEMIQEQKKATKIIAELTMYFLALGSAQISSTILKEGDHGTITFRADYRPEDAQKLQELEKTLNQQRCDSIEEVYWELAGSGDFGESDQLMLVGMMVDRAEVRLEDEFVYVTLYRTFR